MNWIVHVILLFLGKLWSKGSNLTSLPLVNVFAEVHDILFAAAKGAEIRGLKSLLTQGTHEICDALRVVCHLSSYIPPWKHEKTSQRIRLSVKHDNDGLNYIYQLQDVRFLFNSKINALEEFRKKAIYWVLKKCLKALLRV